MPDVPNLDYAGQQRTINDMFAKELFFVGGVAKSGTTWIQILLNAHPEVSCAGEGHFLTSLAPQLANALKQYNTDVGHKNRVVFREFGGFPQLANKNLGFLFVSAALLLMAASEKAREVRVVGEKTPDNMTNPMFLAGLFPGAKFIHVMRDPRDCAVSAWFHNQRLDVKATHNTFPTLSSFVPHVAQSWCDMICKWEDFSASRQAPALIVRYEDMATQPEVELARLFEFLHVSTRPSTIRDCAAAGEFAHLTCGRPAGVEDRASLLRQGLPGDWRNHLADSDDLLCRSIAGDAMRRYGYLD